MKQKFRIWVWTLVLGASVSVVHAVPQDYWIKGKPWYAYTNAVTSTTLADLQHIEVGESNTVYLIGEDDKLLLRYTGDGQFLSSIQDPRYDDCHGIAIGPSNWVYTAKDLADSNHAVYVHSPDLVLLKTITITNFKDSADGCFSVGPDGNLFLGKSDGQDEVMVYDAAGNFLRRFSGDPNNLDAYITTLTQLKASPDGKLFVVDGLYRLKIFTAGGEFVSGRAISNPYYFDSMDIGLDGLSYIVQYAGVFAVHDESGRQLRRITESVGLIDHGVSVDSKGTMFVANRVAPRNLVIPFYRTSYSFPPASRVGVPSPRVLSILQRPSSGIVDVDFQVFDYDDATVNVAALAFFGGNMSLTNALRMQSLVEGTSANLGPGVATGVTHRLSWDLAADVAGNVVPVAVNVMARDSAPMLSFDFIVIPSNGPNPKLVINRVPIFPTDLLPLWYWLIATDDPMINFQNKEVRGSVAAGGAYNGVLLASGTTTTSAGAAFLFERLNVRQATAAELTRAKEASTPGTIHTDTPRLAIEQDPEVSGLDRPYRVNEYGFDTLDNWNSFAGTNWFVVRD